MDYPRDVLADDDECRRRASQVRLILMDVDGVLTDGRIHVSDQGIESRAFDARDGLGIKLGQKAGLTFGIISGRESSLVEKRSRELGIDEIHQRIHDKLGRAREIQERLSIEADAVCYVGDDLIDLPLMRAVGFAAAPADAMAEVRAVAHLVTGKNGGRGAVREVIDRVLQASGRWDDVTRHYYE
jgi:3-deoxy-D-manno-octulosonate 8-phosphate phosphatase (KDO 8-P phosphatase)